MGLRMEKQDKIFGATLVGVLLVYLAVSLSLGSGFALTAFADFVQGVLCLAVVVIAVRNAIRKQDASRIFWILMAVGYFAWWINEACWFYYEVVLRADVPDPFFGDILLFFHIVPFMAALAVRPHKEGSLQRRIFATDSALILLWWLFLYIYIVIPWQYVYSDLATASFYYNLLYLAENGTWIILTALLALRAEGAWRRIYLAFLAPAIVGIAASQEIDLALLQNKYYSGSLYDIPFILTVALQVWCLQWASRQDDRERQVSTPVVDSTASRVASIAGLSLAGFAWYAYAHPRYAALSEFRLELSLVAVVVLGSVSVIRQRFADRERSRLYRDARENYENLRRLQEQVVRSEKMVALGELVGGAAHQINNPLTAILGYAELMEHEPSLEKSNEYAKKISQQVRRTKELVQNLLRFAQRTDATKKLLDLNTVVQNTLQLRNMDKSTKKSVAYQTELDPALPLVWGNGAELMDVCFNLLSNAADALKETGGGSIIVRTRSQQGIVRLEVVDDGPGMLEPRRVFDPFYTTKISTKGSGLGLSVCYGIIRDHQGEIHAENLEGGGARFVVQLPIAAVKKQKAPLATPSSA